MLILKRTILLKKFFDNNLHKDTLLAVSESGYTTDYLSLEWLRHFHNQTKARRNGIYRMLVFDGHGSHLSDDFLVFCWQYNIIPFQLPPHSTHLLQPLDIKVFRPLKHWHQEHILRTIQYGTIEYSKIDFLNGYREMRDRTFKRRTILAAFQEAGLSPISPTIVLDRMKEFDPQPSLRTSTPQDSRPETPPGRPFQCPPATRDRTAHSKYLDMRLDDYIENDIPLTPSFVRSWRAFQSSTEPKIIRAKLIQERETQRIAADLEQRRRKEGSNAWVQQYGVITKGQGLDQITDKYERVGGMQVAVKNMKLERTTKKWNEHYKKKVLQRALEHRVYLFNQWDSCRVLAFNICEELQEKQLALRRSTVRKLAREEDNIFLLEQTLYKSNNGRYWRKDISGQIVPLHARLGAVVIGLEVDKGKESILKQVPLRA